MPRRSALAWLAGLVLLAAASAPRGEPAPVAVNVAVKDGAGQPLDGAVISLVPVSGPLAAKPGTRADVAQRGKQFVPQVTVVQVGTSVFFPNLDTVRHHVYSFSPTKPFELKLYVGTPSTPVVFDKAGTAVLGCNIHDQMLAWVHVVDTPHFSVSAAGGARLEAVPPGEYRLRAWHPRWPVDQPPHEQALKVAVGATPSIHVQLALPPQP
jgi:plastocyanin